MTYRGYNADSYADKSLILRIISVVISVASAAALIASAQAVPQPTITISPDIYYPLDEVLYVEGRALPETRVEVRFQKQGARPLVFTAKSDVNGEWVLAEKIPMEAGDWEVRARTLKGGGINEPALASEWSNPRIFKVIVSGVTIGGINIKFALLTLVIAILLILVLAVAAYYSLRVRRLRGQLLSKEVREAHESVREGLSELRKDILDELHLFESSGRSLAPEELARKEHLLRELERIEKNIDREIADIEQRL